MLSPKKKERKETETAEQQEGVTGKTLPSHLQQRS